MNLCSGLHWTDSLLSGVFFSLQCHIGNFSPTRARFEGIDLRQWCCDIIISIPFSDRWQVNDLERICEDASTFERPTAADLVTRLTLPPRTSDIVHKSASPINWLLTWDPANTQDSAGEEVETIPCSPLTLALTAAGSRSLVSTVQSFGGEKIPLFKPSIPKVATSTA